MPVLVHEQWHAAFHVPMYSQVSTSFYAGASNNAGFMLILHNFPRHPLSCKNVCTPSRIRMCVKPITLMNSSLECSDRVGIVLVTRNIVLMMS